MHETRNGAPIAPLEYVCCYGLDLIKGTKEQIQSFGIGLNVTFPGELNTPEGRISTVDPRGWRVVIYHEGRGRFAAHAHFPNIPDYPQPWQFRAFYLKKEEAFPGVTLEMSLYSDCFIGSADALINAGLVRDEQLPGPGRPRRTCVTWRPDGTMLPRGANGHEPGSVHIARKSGRTFNVRIRIASEESERRHQAHDEALKSERENWMRAVEAMPRPPRLKPLPQWQLNRLEAAGVADYQRRSNVVELRAWKVARNMGTARR